MVLCHCSVILLMKVYCRNVQWSCDRKAYIYTMLPLWISYEWLYTLVCANCVLVTLACSWESHGADTPVICQVATSGVGIHLKKLTLKSKYLGGEGGFKSMKWPYRAFQKRSRDVWREHRSPRQCIDLGWVSGLLSINSEHMVIKLHSHHMVINISVFVCGLAWVLTFVDEMSLSMRRTIIPVLWWFTFLRDLLPKKCQRRSRIQ